MSKWGDRPHWEFEAVYLGSDEHGDWCGVAGGTLFTRPGVEWLAPVDQVMLRARRRPLGSGTGWRRSTPRAARSRCTST